MKAAGQNYKEAIDNNNSSLIPTKTTFLNEQCVVSAVCEI